MELPSGRLRNGPGLVGGGQADVEHGEVVGMIAGVMRRTGGNGEAIAGPEPDSRAAGKVDMGPAPQSEGELAHRVCVPARRGHIAADRPHDAQAHTIFGESGQAEVPIAEIRPIAVAADDPDKH